MNRLAIPNHLRYLIAILFCPFFVSAKDSSKTHHHYLFTDIGGPAGLASLNYDYKIAQLFNVGIFGSVGIGTYKVVDFTRKFNPDIIIPFGITLASMDRKTQPIVGFGGTYANLVRAKPMKKIRVDELSFWFKLGYRFSFNQKRTYLQAAYVSIREYKMGQRNWAGITIGQKL